MPNVPLSEQGPFPSLAAALTRWDWSAVHLDLIHHAVRRTPLAAVWDYRPPASNPEGEDNKAEPTPMQEDDQNLKPAAKPDIDDVQANANVWTTWTSSCRPLNLCLNCRVPEGVALLTST